jgi:hypothetical protein
MTVPAVSDVLALQARHRSTTDDRVANRYGSPTTPHFGHENPSGQRMDSRYRAQAASSGNTRWNSGREVGKPRMSIIATMADRYDLVKQTDKQGSILPRNIAVGPDLYGRAPSRMARSRQPFVQGAPGATPVRTRGFTRKAHVA